MQVFAEADDELAKPSGPQACVRHISSIQIRNLLPFPARDTLASVLTQRLAVSPASSPTTKRRLRSSSSGSATIRRPRTVSHSSALEIPAETLSPSFEASTSKTGSSWLNDTFNSQNSQKELEKVIWSRLMETFLSINLPEGDELAPSSPTPSSVSEEQVASKKNAHLRRPHGSVDAQRTNARPPSGSPMARHTRQAASFSSSSVTKNRRRTSSPPASAIDVVDTSAQSSASPRKTAFPRSPPLTPPPVAYSDVSPVPIFISSFHRPSTNPKFELDSADTAFAKWANLSTDRVIGKGKEKEVATEDGFAEHEGGEWSLLSAWDMKVTDLVPLPNDLAEQPWKLPENSLIVTLANSNRAYYLPSTLVSLSPIPSRSHSPDYSSDTEVSRRNAAAPHALIRGRQRKSQRELKSANLNEIVKLVSLQASLSDARSLLSEVVRSCDQLIEEDRCSILRREASERDYHLQRLQEQQDVMDDIVKSTRLGISSLREQLHQRRMRLAEARALYEDDLLTEFDAGVRLSDERRRVQTLRKQKIEPMRTSLLSTLAFIFPIELLSPPDLLYTILSVPLPIPLQGTDPAPPLSLPFFSAVNEDSVATALGYAALVVQLMAVYLCRGLVYPITFPLYSKGVDTYRFEYAVFLLNKDIELLMADLNLRALDLRHTLFNLKNLLLTLTSGEIALPKPRLLPSPSVVSITSGLQSPGPIPAGTTEPSPLSLDETSTTPKSSAIVLPAVDADDTESALGMDGASMDTSSSAGTATLSSGSTIRPRMPRIQIQSYLGLAPLTSMWRTRYPSTASTSKSEDAQDVDAATISASASTSTSTSSESPTSESSLESSESTSPDEESCEEDEDDEDDRRTVRGASVPTTPITEVRSDRSFGIAALDNLKIEICGTNGHAPKALADEEVDSEKHRDVVPVRTPPLTR
ncbi:hypothetical protein EW145_g688 [Phellinidium pouzarii]|uniref:UV radiation resistance-associated gene protein n=1 Tax=Phellinidium pouzarii TaxID=167371 RepID=A0A4S4LMX0_9AGAM|nr:hypothetical protein EW145_g688 [Phellinidium pouzarii]